MRGDDRIFHGSKRVKPLAASVMDSFLRHYRNRAKPLPQPQLLRRPSPIQ
jgi:hypothetical protein